MVEQTVSPWEPQETKVVPESSPRGGEVVYQSFHTPHDDEITFQLLRNAVNSSLQTIEPVATFMLLPHWRGFSCNAYMTWLNHFPGLVQVLANFPAGSIQFQTPQH
eukprot:1154470-Pelagomonas_calceolata.AAC.10